MQTAGGKDQGSRILKSLLEVYVFSVPLLLTGLILKIEVLREGGFADVRAMLGVPRLSYFQYLHLFAGEIWEGLVLFPVALLILGWFLPFTWKRWLYFVLLELAIFIQFAEAGTYHLVGEFFSKELAGDFFSTLRSNPGFVSPRALMTRNMQWAFWLILAFGVVPLVLWFFLARSPFVERLWRKCWKISLAIVVLALVVTGFPPLNTAGLNFYRAGSLVRSTRDLLQSSGPSDTSVDEMPLTPPMKAYDDAVFPEGKDDENSSLVAAIAPSRPNVIYVVLETTGYKDYPFYGPRSRMPRVSSLLPHSLTAEKHYSTEDESIRSGFTLYSSMYELMGQNENQYFIRHLTGAKNPRRLDSLPRILADQGYATRYYYGFTLWPKAWEEGALNTLGFQKVRIVREMPIKADDGEAENPIYLPKGQRVENEKALYQMAGEDIRKFHSDGQPFFMSIVASIGHAPFLDIRPPDAIAKDPNPSREVLLGNLAEFQDGLIGDLIDELKELGILDDTILVITGDHGPRTRREDPEMNLRFADDENYHVPLLIWYGHGLSKPVVIDHLTSHLDLVPTVLQLMGLNKTQYLQQGMSMFDKASEQRVTFLLDWHMRGFDTAYYKGNFVMYSHVNNNIYQNNAFHFSSENQVVNPSPDSAAQRLTSAILDFRRVQRIWISYFRNAGDTAAGQTTQQAGSPRQ
jgi:arylsulfatase A-like enzyme